jgi:hypothetical protein
MKSLLGTAYDLFVLYPKWYFIEVIVKPIGRAHFNWEDPDDD